MLLNQQMNSKIFILKISDIIELGCRFLVQYICREMLINAYEVFCPSVPVCIKIVDGGARRRRRAVCAVPFSLATLVGSGKVERRLYILVY